METQQPRQVPSRRSHRVQPHHGRRDRDIQDASAPEFRGVSPVEVSSGGTMGKLLGLCVLTSFLIAPFITEYYENNIDFQE